MMYMVSRVWLSKLVNYEDKMSSLNDIEEYRESKLSMLAEANGAGDIFSVISGISFRKFRTISEFEVSWLRMCRLIEKSDSQKKNSLPIGHPDGLEAFANDESPSLMRRQKSFMSKELFPDDYVGEAGLWTVTTSDKAQDVKHICFTRRWGRRGINVARAIENLATNIYYESNILTKKSNEKFIFYEHIFPDPMGQFQESFALLNMEFKDGHYRSPQWSHYDSIPKVISSARFILALIEAMAIAEITI